LDEFGLPALREARLIPEKDVAMPKMTRKGQQFVGKEIGRMVRKGPGSGPQKGKPMKPKQAVAVALNVARKKGYKVPPRKTEAVLLRGPEYGALALVETENGWIVYDHNLLSEDKRAILAVLETACRPSSIEDGGTRWSFGGRAHPSVIASNLQRAIQVAGYTEDVLSARAIMRTTVEEARNPDLPVERRFDVIHEAVEAGLRRHLEIACAALIEGEVRATPPTVKFYSRPNAKDSLGRPLPFVVARAFAEGDRDEVERKIREALEPVSDYLVRATASDLGEGEPLSVDVALAPPASVCEAYMDAAIPTFTNADVNGARTVWFKLGAALEEDAVEDFRRLCAVSTGATAFRVERDGRAIVAQVPSCNEGHYVADTAFQERLDWLTRLLDPWDPEVYEVSEQVSILSGAPGGRSRIQEGLDDEIRMLQRAAAQGDVRSEFRLKHLLQRASVGRKLANDALGLAGFRLPDDLDPDPVPRQLDADAVRDLELHIDNTSRLYGQRRNIEKNLLRKMQGKTYRRDLAAKAWMYWVDDGAKDYAKEFGGDWSVTFPKKLREFLAMQYAKRFERQVRDGEITESRKKRKKRTGITAAQREKERKASALRRKKMTSAAKEKVKKQRRARYRKYGESMEEGWGGKGVDPVELRADIARGMGISVRDQARLKSSLKDMGVTGPIEVAPGDVGQLVIQVTDPSSAASAKKMLRKLGLSVSVRKINVGPWTRAVVGEVSSGMEEAFTPTHGMANAAFGVAGAARVCKACGVGFPKYRGRYPETCPKCKTRGSVVMAEERGLAESPPGNTRETIGSEILGRPYTMNVATISIGEATSFAKDAFERAGLRLYDEIPDFDRNLVLLKRKMRHALDIPRIQMPVIEPADLGKFEKDLKAGRVDIFKPYASGKLGGGNFPWYPELHGGKAGKEWITLGTKDGDSMDDIVVPRPGMVPVKNLKPLQGEIWFDKLIGSLLKFGIPKAGGFLLTNATIIVSQEGYILDGHHRFGQAMLADPGLKIKALQVPMDIHLLLKVGRSYGSAIGNKPKESAGVSAKLREASVLRMKGSGKGGGPTPMAKNTVAQFASDTPDYDELLQTLRDRLKAKRQQFADAKRDKPVAEGLQDDISRHGQEISKDTFNAMGSLWFYNGTVWYLRGPSARFVNWGSPDAFLQRRYRPSQFPGVDPEALRAMS
jgi:hypothetical protein